MRKTLFSTAAALGLAILSISPVLADDPCHGHGVACDTGGCVVCWPKDGGGIDCTEASYADVSMTLPGCVPPLPSNDGIGELAIPESLRLPELIGTGGRTVVPETRPPAPRLPTTPSF